MSMTIKYWGVRGSTPAPMTSQDVIKKQEALITRILAEGGTEKLFPNGEGIKEYLKTLPLSFAGTYGGNTTCIELRIKDAPLIVIDSGTGMRRLGEYLIGRLFRGESLNPLNSDEQSKRQIHLFFTHYHWDHLQGFPFFAPAFIGLEGKVVDMHFYGKRDARTTISDVLIGQQEYPNFPVVWEDMPCTKEYTMLGRLNNCKINLGAAQVKYQELTHPDGVFAYRIDAHGNSFVCATDTEHKDNPDPRLVNLARNADILYYDGAYTPQEYLGEKGPNKFDWGHSTYEWAIRNALAANVRHIVIGHHEPSRSDFSLDELEGKAQWFKNDLIDRYYPGKILEVTFAYDELEHAL